LIGSFLVYYLICFLITFLEKKHRDEEAHIAILLSLGSWIENSADGFV